MWDRHLLFRDCVLGGVSVPNAVFDQGSRAYKFLLFQKWVHQLLGDFDAASFNPLAGIGIGIASVAESDESEDCESSERQWVVDRDNKRRQETVRQSLRASLQR